MKNLLKSLTILATALILSMSQGFGQNEIVPLRPDYWSDEVFIKKFTYGYTPKTTTEPSITTEEKELFEILVPLIRSDVNAAINTLRASILPESSPALDFTLGNLYFETGDFQGAIRQYLTSIQKLPNFERAYSLLGKVHVRIGEMDKAVPYLVKTIELGGADSDIYGLLGYCYLNQEKFDSALSAYEQGLLYDPNNTDWKLGKAQALLILQKWRESIGIFEELIAKFPDKAEYWLLQANAYLGIRDTAQSAANYEVLRRMKKARPDSLFQLGDIYMNDGLADLAYPVYVEALQADPKQNVRRPLMVAKILTDRGVWKDASLYLSSMRNTFNGRLTDDEELEILTLESRIALATGDDEKASESLKAIIKRNPLAGEALLLLAGFQANKGEIEEAILNYESAREIDSFKRRALLEQAQMHVRQEEYEDAVPLLKDALEIQAEDRIQKYMEAVEHAALSKRLL